MRFSICRITIYMLFACLASGSTAQTPYTDPKAQPVIDEMMKYYNSITKYYSKTVDTETITPGLAKGAGNAISEFKIWKPNRIAITTNGVLADGFTTSISLTCDGSYVWLYISRLNQYTKTKMPGTLADLLKLDKYKVLCSADAYALVSGMNPFNVRPKTSRLSLGDPVNINGIDMDVLEVTNSTPSVQTVARAMVSQKDHIYRRSVLHTVKKMPKGVSLTYNITSEIELTEISPEFTAEDFTFTPPPGAKLVAAFPELHRKADKATPTSAKKTK